MSSAGSLAGPMPERRGVPRHRTLISGVLREKSRAATWTCMVRNLSEEGARIEIANPHWVTDNVEFAISVRDIERQASVIWRGERSIGLAFGPKPDAMHREAQKEINRLRLQGDALRRRFDEQSGY
jgi:hypothetical protein